MGDDVAGVRDDRQLPALHARDCEAEGFAWWTARIRAALSRYDCVRIDHFRGFEAYWEIPADAETAASGRWQPGPGLALFAALRDALAED